MAPFTWGSPRWTPSFNEAGAWEPRMAAARPPLCSRRSSFNEAGAWKPRMATLKEVEEGTDTTLQRGQGENALDGCSTGPGCGVTGQRFNEAGAWEPRMAGLDGHHRQRGDPASMRPGLGSPGWLDGPGRQHQHSRRASMRPGLGSPGWLW